MGYLREVLKEIPKKGDSGKCHNTLKQKNYFRGFLSTLYVTYTLLYCVKKNNYINHVINDIKS